MSFNIFTMKSLFSWALKAQAPRKSLQPVQASRLFSEFSGKVAEEDTSDVLPSNKKPFTKENALEKSSFSVLTMTAADKVVETSTSINEVRLLGRVGKDPVIFEGKKKPYVFFPLATSSLNWDSENSQYNEITEWHSIVNYNPQKMENISRFLKKGDRVYVSGKLIYRAGSGTDNKTCRIILTDFVSMYS